MKIMITGGAGYIGTELVYRLAGEPGVSEVLVYDNLCKGNYNLFTGLRKVPGNNVRFVQGDILDSRNLKQHMSGVEYVSELPEVHSSFTCLIALYLVETMQNILCGMPRILLFFVVQEISNRFFHPRF